MAFAGSAVADGALIRWNSIVGVTGQDVGQTGLQNPNLTVYDLNPAASWIWVEGGHATLNLGTGQFHFVARHISWANNALTASNPIGWVLGSAGFPRQAHFVCDARGAFGGPLRVSTVPFYLDNTGSVDLAGTVTLPQLCTDHPDQIAFLIGGANRYNYFAFGAGAALLTGGHGGDQD
jgi:hypothetical protein